MPESSCRPTRESRTKVYSGSDVTVLISSKDDAALLVRAIRSVFSQTERVFEIIVVDDGSTDQSSINLLRRYSEIGAIRLLRRPNAGLVASRRILLDHERAQS